MKKVIYQNMTSVKHKSRLGNGAALDNNSDMIARFITPFTHESRQ